MSDLERVLFLIHCGEALNAGQWARKLAKAAFSNNYHLRSF
jgi:hypothetical protein